MADDTMQTYVELKLGTKTVQLYQDEYKDVTDNFFARIKPYVATLSKSYKTNLKIHEGYLETAELRNGYLKAVSLVVATRFGSIKMPNASLATKAGTAMGALERAVSSKSVTDLQRAWPEAEEALNAYQEDTFRFLKELGASAYATGTALSVTSSVGFAVLGAMVASLVVVPAGASAGIAAAVSSAGVKALQSATEELAKAALGEDMSAWESVEKVVLDTTIAGATAGIMSKIPSDLFKPMATSAAGKIASKLTYVSSAQMQAFVIRYLEGTGNALVQTAASEAVDTVTKMVRSGKPPSEKDLTDSFEKVLIATLTGGFLRNLETFEKKAIYAMKDQVEGKMLLDMIAKAVQGTPPGRTEQVKIAAEIMKAAQDEVAKSGIKGALDVARGDETPDELVASALKTVDKDTALRRLLEAETRAVLKKRKIPVR